MSSLRKGVGLMIRLLSSQSEKPTCGGKTQGPYPFQIMLDPDNPCFTFLDDISGYEQPSDVGIQRSTFNVQTQQIHPPGSSVLQLGKVIGKNLGSYYGKLKHYNTDCSSQTS